MLGVFNKTLYPPNKQSIPCANPATKKFFKRLPTLGAFWLYTLHHTVALASTVATEKFLLDVLIGCPIKLVVHRRIGLLSPP
jgi:hypothetical protein